MAKFRYVQSNFWDDENLLDEFTPEDKYFYLFLLTNPRTKQCGIYGITIKQIEFYTGYNRESIELLIDRFENKHKKIRYNQKTKELAIKNWLKYNDSTSINTQKCIAKEFNEVKDKSLIEYLTRPLQAPYKDHVSSDGQKEKEKEKEKEKKEASSLSHQYIISIFCDNYEKLHKTKLIINGKESKCAKHIVEGLENNFDDPKIEFEKRFKIFKDRIKTPPDKFYQNIKLTPSMFLSIMNNLVEITNDEIDKFCGAAS